MEHKKEANGAFEEGVSGSTRLRGTSWKQMIVRMRERVEKAEKLLASNRAVKDARLQKKLGMMRLAILNQLEIKKTQEVDTAFLLETIDLINRMEEMLEQYEMDILEWFEFINAIEKKLEEEGMLVEDAELAKQSMRLKSAIDRLRSKLERKGPFKPLD